MIANFKGSFTIDGVNFPAGEHILNKEQSKHWYTQGLISDGLVEVIRNDIEAEVVEEVATTEEAPQVEAVEEVATEIKTRKKRG
ncbi:MAG: hypothetical protein LUQ28_15080 [Methylococcaceae bacterium]|nr:hypothetical protein [Methylococcaceae bacterium]